MAGGPKQQNLVISWPKEDHSINLGQTNKLTHNVNKRVQIYNADGIYGYASVTSRVFQLSIADLQLFASG